MLSKRTFLLAIALIVAGSLISGTLETEGPNHQFEAHHCAVCCTTHYAATPAEPVRFNTALAASALPLITLPLPYTEFVIRLLDPPPKLLT